MKAFKKQGFLGNFFQDLCNCLLLAAALVPHIPDSTWMIGIPTVKVRWGKMAPHYIHHCFFCHTCLHLLCAHNYSATRYLASYKQRVVVAALQLLLEGRINVRRIDKPQENRTVKGIFSLSSLINIRLMSVPAAAKSKAVLCTVCIYGEVVQPKRRNTSY